MGAFYLVSELSDNISEHSEFTHGSVMVQFFKNKGHIDIGVLDNGLTIPGVYSTNSISFLSDSDAILKALRGVSTKINESGRGRGLGTSKRLVQEGLNGEFHILSRNGLVIIKPNQEPVNMDIDAPLNGTFVYMRFKVPEKDLNIYEYVE
ncbi:ATP-binding protein [Candidatus Pacearchaeota archaeon]|nr:ATP-binding protein [Candidatus Pacearchaeota archaeon]